MGKMVLPATTATTWLLTNKREERVSETGGPKGEKELTPQNPLEQEQTKVRAGALPLLALGTLGLRRAVRRPHQAHEAKTRAAIALQRMELSETPKEAHTEIRTVVRTM